MICFIEQLFTDNKHLIETIQSMEIEKNDILNIPYITNTIKKNDILKNIQDIISNENYKEDESSSEQIDELISCIQSNLQSN